MQLEVMDQLAFESLKNDFRDADTDDKINIYIGAEGLSQHQYKELLRLFPLDALNRLEEALG